MRMLGAAGVLLLCATVAVQAQPSCYAGPNRVKNYWQTYAARNDCGGPVTVHYRLTDEGGKVSHSSSMLAKCTSGQVLQVSNKIDVEFTHFTFDSDQVATRCVGQVEGGRPQPKDGKDGKKPPPATPVRGAPPGSAAPVPAGPERWQFCQAERERHDALCTERFGRDEAGVRCRLTHIQSESDCRQSGEFAAASELTGTTATPAPSPTPKPGTPLRERASNRECTLFSAPCYGRCKSEAQMYQEIEASGCTLIPGSSLANMIANWRRSQSQAGTPRPGGGGGQRYDCRLVPVEQMPGWCHPGDPRFPYGGRT